MSAQSTEPDVDIEEVLPRLAGQAFTKARAATLKAGLSVIERQGDELVEVFPDGTMIALKKLEPKTPVQAGVKFKVRLK